ncbi:MAG: hypothetical protein HOP19_07900, partial [Acidobacteria bacterium]|nr:hypothetical protein [Acidobacteriota bacterium]
TMKSNHFTTKLVVLLSVVLLTALSGFAQEAPKPQLSRVSVTQVKPEMWEQFLAFYKNETLPALKKGGIKQSLVMQSSGPVGNGYELRVVQPVESLAQLDEGSALTKALGPEGRKAYDAKRRTMIVSSHAYIIRSIPEAAIAQNGTSKLMVRREISVVPGRRADYETYQKDLLAVLKKTNLKGHRVSRMVIGGDLNTYYHVDSFDSWAEYEKFQEGLSKVEGYSKLAGRTVDVVMHTTLSRYAPMPELGITPTPVNTANK